MKENTRIRSGLSAVKLALLGALALAASSSPAAPIMPAFSGLTAGWTTDRYEPAGFANVGTVAGRGNVLGITIDASTAALARPAGQQGAFYNTQGRKFIHAPAHGAGAVLSADLYIPAAWGNAAHGHRRSDLWGTLIDSAAIISAYPIIGFTNYGGAPRLRVFDGDIGWVDLATPVSYDAWTKFSIELLADKSIAFHVNGARVYIDKATGGAVAFKEVIMQAYNFDEASIAGAIITPYTAHWSNSPAATTSSFTVTPADPIFGVGGNNVLPGFGDAAPGFPTQSFASNGVAKTDIYFTPEALFGRPVLLGQIASLSYWTKTGTTHAVDPRDWYLNLYTKPFAGDASTPTWHGSRIGSEPYYSDLIADPANTWNQWSTGGASNRMRFFESTQGAPGANFGSYTDPAWAAFLALPSSLGTTVSYATQEALFISLQTASGWAAGFTGKLDGLRVELNDGSIATVNFEGDLDEPVAVNTAVAPAPVAIGHAGSIVVTASIDDTLTGNSPIASAQFRVNGGAWLPMAASDSSFNSPAEAVTGSFTLATAGITQPGLYLIEVRGYDAGGNVSNIDGVTLPVYDPTAGFVTGGGAIDSAAGAYRPDLALTGRAQFAFVSKYAKGKAGAAELQGNTQFIFKAGSFHFSSSAYDWLIVNQNGQNAQFKGAGTVNGAGSYGFMIWAGDGAKSSSADTFRISIWDRNNADAIVYDNGTDQAIATGSIVIHTAK